MNETLKNFLADRASEGDQIDPARQIILGRLATAIQRQIRSANTVQLLFVCTHNSRRSQLSQALAGAAAEFFQVDLVQTYSGGTEATAPSPLAIGALRRVGFEIIGATDAGLARFQIAGDSTESYYFSKTIDDPANPRADFIAVMTCSEADVGCPVVPGAVTRISLPYVDPKAFDDTPQVDEKYSACLADIARDLLFVFARVSA